MLLQLSHFPHRYSCMHSRKPEFEQRCLLRRFNFYWYWQNVHFHRKKLYIWMRSLWNTKNILHSIWNSVAKVWISFIKIALCSLWVIHFLQTAEYFRNGFLKAQRKPFQGSVGVWHIPANFYAFIFTLCPCQRCVLTSQNSFVITKGWFSSLWISARSSNIFPF